MTKRKVIHYASHYLYSNFGEFWIKEKSPNGIYKVCAGFENLEKELASGPLASSPRRPTAGATVPTD
jgi:hypothetical protein